MHGRTARFLLTAVLVLFAASYSIYTAVRYFYSPYQTETAFSYTIADSYRARAVALREEELLEGQVEGVLSYVCADGEVVIPGMTIAEVYSDDNDLHWQTLAGQYEREISLLREAQKTSAQYLGTDMLDSRINEAAGDVVDVVARSELVDLPTARNSLLQMLDKKQIATGRQTDFSGRISYLTAQMQYAQSQISQAHGTIQAKTGGYFCSVIDGYETLLTTDFDVLSIDDIRRIANGTLKPLESSGIGKVQKDHDWYLAIIVSKDKSARFLQGAMVTVDFNMSSCNNIPASVYLVRDGEDGSTLVIFRTNRINEQLIALRTATVDIRLRSYTGLKVSARAIRYEGQTEGVYVREGNLIMFKPIDRIYEDGNFVLCSDSSSVENPLRLFDEVIVEGSDLYDGKLL